MNKTNNSGQEGSVYNESRQQRLTEKGDVINLNAI